MKHCYTKRFIVTVVGMSDIDLPDDDLLDAVVAEVTAYGVRRAIATSIAQRAGVSRVTVYRRGGGIKALVLDALVAEFARSIDEVDRRVAAQVRPANGRETVVARAVGIIDALGEAPLVHALLRHDPELLVPYLVDRMGRSQQLLLASLEQAITEGIHDGSIRPGDPALMARTLMHALGPFVVGTRIVETFGDRAAVLAEVQLLVDSYLRPSSEPVPDPTHRGAGS